MERTTFGWVASITTALLSVIGIFCSIEIMITLDGDFISGFQPYIGSFVASALCVIIHMIFYFREHLIHPGAVLGISVLLMIGSFLSFIFFMLYFGYDYKDFYSYRDAIPYIYIGTFATLGTSLSYLLYTIFSTLRLFDLKEEYVQSGNTNYFDLATKEYPTGTKWLRFHTFWRLPCGGVISVLIALSSFISIVADFEHAEVYLFVNFICRVPYALLSLLAISSTKRLEPRGFTLNVALFVTNIFSNIILISFAAANLLSFNAATGVVSSIISVCEIIYFIKRRDLFYHTQELYCEDATIAQEEDPVTGPKLQHSLSRESEQPKNSGNHGIYGKDILLETAPTTETLPTTETTPDVETVPSAETEETSELSQIEIDIEAREKAYAKIEKFHEYYEKGIITEEEYNQSRQRVLEALKIETK